MIQKRSLGMCLILSIVTCGIYGLVWMVQLANDVNTLSGDNSTSGGTVLLLSLVTCGIYGWFWLYRCGERIDGVKGNSQGHLSLLFLVLGLFGLAIVAYAIMQDEINRLAP